MKNTFLLHLKMDANLIFQTKIMGQNKNSQIYNHLRDFPIFSIGQFSSVQSNFSKAITWQIVGERQLSGFNQVVKLCQSIAQYFKTVRHQFYIQAIYQSGLYVMIQSKTYFPDTNLATRIATCEVYAVDALNQLIQIQFYCISI